MRCARDAGAAFVFATALTSLRTRRCFPAPALLEEALADPFLAGTPGSASAAALKHAALKNLGRVLDAAGDGAAPAALDAYAAAAELDASDVVLWCAPRALALFAAPPPRGDARPPSSSFFALTPLFRARTLPLSAQAPPGRACA